MRLSPAWMHKLVACWHIWRARDLPSSTQPLSFCTAIMDGSLVSMLRPPLLPHVCTRIWNLLMFVPVLASVSMASQLPTRAGVHEVYFSRACPEQPTSHYIVARLTMCRSAVVLGGEAGEHAEWRKFTTFELATRVPFIVRPPPGWLPKQRVGGRADGFVELVDLMPTMAALAAIASPIAPGETPLGGRSVVPLLQGAVRDVKPGAFSQYARRALNASEEWHDNSILHANRTTFTHMGYSIRTHEWRYTEWRRWNGSTLAAVWTPEGVHARELYDHRNETLYPTDFDAGEDFNWAANDTVARPFAETIADLSRRLRLQFAPTSAARL